MFYSSKSFVSSGLKGRDVLIFLVAGLSSSLVQGYDSVRPSPPRSSQTQGLRIQNLPNLPPRQLSQIIIPVSEVDSDSTDSYLGGGGSNFYEFVVNAPLLTDAPTRQPSLLPAKTPTRGPSDSPTRTPSDAPATTPSESTIIFPSSLQTQDPTDSPSESPAKSPSRAPTTSSSQSPTNSPTGSPSTPTGDTPRNPPTEPPTVAPTPTNSPTILPTEYPSTTPKPTDNPTSLPTETESRIMQEVIQAQEQDVESATATTEFLPEDTTSSTNSNQREPNSPEGQGETGTGTDQAELEGPAMADESQTSQQGDNNSVDATEAADQFLPVPDPKYYFVELRPFSVFVDAARDLTTDLGIPLYLFLEMGETLATLVDIKITNLTIHMGVVMTQSHHNHNLRHHRHRYQRQLEGYESNHYHWNQLFFQGLAQFDDSTVYPNVTVQNVQSLVLSNEAGLQQFWDDEGYGETYDNLELQNITLLPFPPPPTEPPETPPPTILTTTEPPQPTYPPQHQDSKRESNVWIIVSLVLVFLLVCFCLICLAGRLQYLGSRAQDKYNEKYGLDYNVYDKDIGKEIFKEEYLMSEHNDDSQGHLSDSLRSIDYLTKSIKNARRSSLKQAKKQQQPPPPPEEQSTEEEEEEMQGSFTAGVVRKVFPAEEDRNAYYSHNGPMASARSEDRMSNTSSSEQRKYSSSERGSEKNVVIDEGIILPKLGVQEEEEEIVVPPERGNEDEVAESVPPDEGIALMPKTPSEVKLDGGDSLPPLMKAGTMMDSSERDASARSTSQRRRESANRRNSAKRRGSKEITGMGNSSARERSFRSRGSFNAGDDKGVMGNSSRGSRGDRSSRFNRNLGSFTGAVGEEANAMGSSGRGDRSTRSNRSTRSQNSESSIGSFYSCQGDLV